MTLGQKIKKLRMEKNLTQKDLADQVHVTFQTVSKWEKDENEPDISTLRELSKIFNCSMDELLNENEIEEEPVNESEPSVVTPIEEPVTKTIIIHQNELHVCARCGKDIPENELVSEDKTKQERVGRYTRTVNIGQTYYHKACLEEVKKERIERKKRERATHASSSKKKCFGWGIFAGLVGLGISLGVFLGVEACKEIIHPGLAVLYAVLIGYALFADLYCILSGSYIGDVFVTVAGWSIKFPGLIFSWDIEGFIWVIAMKILFAILGFMFGVFVLGLAIGLSAALAAVSFPFILIHNNHTQYEDAF